MACKSQVPREEVQNGKEATKRKGFFFKFIHHNSQMASCGRGYASQCALCTSFFVLFFAFCSSGELFAAPHAVVLEHVSLYIFERDFLAYAVFDIHV